MALHILRTSILSIFLLVGSSWAFSQQENVGEIPPSAQAYLQQRNSWQAQDKLMRFDADLELDSLELVVQNKLTQVREQMRSYYDSVSFFPPSADFLRFKDHIERTPLFALLRQMPKGGLSHLHPAAAIDFEWMLDTALKMPRCYVFWEEEHERYVKGEIHFWGQDQVPPGFFPIHYLNQVIPNFKEEMLDMLVLTERETGPGFPVWKEFEKVFQRFYGFVNYQPIFKACYHNLIDSLLADGVQHPEFRIIPRPLYDLVHEPGYYSEDTLIQYLADLEKEVQAKAPHYSHKVIVTDLRFRSREATYTSLLEAFVFRQRHPDLIKGFDLVANEDAGNSTLHFLDSWMKLDSLEEAFGIDMPLYLHDGESAWGSVDNLYDAVLLNSRRIGHGFNLNHYPTLIEEIKKRDICLEVSPLSNQILGYLQDLRVHPASFLLKKGVQCSINSDDPSIFGYMGMSYDFWSIFLAWELDLKALKKLCMNSLTYSSLSVEEKETALNHWEKEWTAFLGYANGFLK